MRIQTFLVVFASTLLLAGNTIAATTTYVIVDNGMGLDSGYACLSSTGTGCSIDQSFAVAGTSAVSGSFTYDSLAGTVDIDITLATATMSGSYDGVSGVVFSSVNYSVNGMSAMSFGSQLFGYGVANGDIVGTYEQTFGGATVAGPDAINPMSTLFNGFSCSGLDGVGLCGLTVGADRAFDLNVGTTGTGDSFDFVHTFSFNVNVAPASHMPEPAAAMVFGVGFMIVARRVRTPRQ